MTSASTPPGTGAGGARSSADLVNPKFEILDGVWEYDFEGDPNIVEVYVRRLRSKIDEPFGRHDLETVRGAGYRLASNGA